MKATSARQRIAYNNLDKVVDDGYKYYLQSYAEKRQIADGTFSLSSASNSMPSLTNMEVKQKASFAELQENQTERLNNIQSAIAIKPKAIDESLVENQVQSNSSEDSRLRFTLHRNDVSVAKQIDTVEKAKF